MIQKATELGVTKSWWCDCAASRLQLSMLADG